MSENPSVTIEDLRHLLEAERERVRQMEEALKASLHQEQRFAARLGATISNAYGLLEEAAEVTTSEELATKIESFIKRSRRGLGDSTHPEQESNDA